MTTVTLQLSDELKTRLESCAAAAGHASVEQYLQSVLDDLADDLGGPPSLTFDTPEALERLIEARLDDTAGEVEATPQFWEDLRRRSLQRRSKAE